MIGVLALAAQLAVVVHGPDIATACDALEISVAVSATGSAAPQLIAPSLAPFDVLRSTSVPHVTYDPRGRGSVMAEFRYVVTTDRIGNFTIPSFEARLGPSVARSRPLDISVRPMTGRENVPTVVARARIDTSLEVNFRALAMPETVFVGQQANYEVAVFLNQVVRDRLRRNPTFFPPDMQSMLAYDMPAQRDPPRRQVGSHCFDALVYQRALFPLMPGRFSIPPAQLVYALPASASFFSREESHELLTDSTVIVAVDPPSAGRPAGWAGAVGSIRVAAKLDTVASRVGDPLLLTVRVSGNGNVKLFPRPQVGVPWGTLVKGDERVHVDTTARRVAGSKEFDWVLTPRIAGELDVPPIRYSYFNPDTRRYEVASTSPSHVRVAPGTLAALDTARPDAMLALRPRYRGVPPTPLSERPVFWAVLALLPLPALTIGGRGRRRRPTPRVASSEATLAALPRDAVAARDPRRIRRAYTRALHERLDIESESFTRPGGLSRALRRRGVSPDVALDAQQFLHEMDEAAFSPQGTLAEKAAERAVALYKTIDIEALPRSPARVPGAVRAVCVAGLLAIGVATAHAYDVTAAQAAFDRGATAYQKHEFVVAREAFGAAVAAEPRAPDAWADLGTASWAVADTARSVAAWQRALRIEPLASDVRDRVELVHSLTWRSAGYVPPIAAWMLFDAAAVLWCLAWGAAAYRAARSRRWGGRGLAYLATSAGILAVIGFALTDRLSGRNLGVVRQTLTVSAEPRLGSDVSATAIIGEVVRVSGRQGAWSRVVLDDGRDGWIESAALLALDARDASEIEGASRGD